LDENRSITTFFGLTPKLGMVVQNFTFWPKFRLKFKFLTKIIFFNQNYLFNLNFNLRPKIQCFYQTFDLWPKFQFLTKISIFDQNFNFWPKFQLFTKVSIFHKNQENLKILTWKIVSKLKHELENSLDSENTTGHFWPRTPYQRIKTGYLKNFFIKADILTSS